MTQLAPITLEDGTVIYMEATEDLTAPTPLLAPDEAEPEGQTRTDKGLGDRMRKSVNDNFRAVQGTIRTYTRNTLNAFKDISDVNVDKVTLEFGVKVAGEAGVPYVTQGTAECNLKITVECSYPRDKSATDR